MFFPLKARCSPWWSLTVLTWLLPILVVIPVSSKNITKANGTSCAERDRQALLSFRSGLVDHLNLLSSWRSDDKDCCLWIGVHCSPETGHVTALDLSPKVFQQIANEAAYLSLGGEISPSLLNLTYLSYLDLSSNNFSSFPAFIGSLNGLRYLNLSWSSNSFYGAEDLILDSVGTITSLEHLDLSRNYLTGQIPMSWGNLCNLITIDLSYTCKLSGTLNSFHNWTRCPQSPVLREFRAPENELTGPFDITKFTSLEVLDVSSNLLNGSLSDGIWRLSNLTILDISNNLFIGFLPETIGKLSNLIVLDISNNNFTGVLPETIWKLSNLTFLDVGSNFLEGLISDSHFSKLHRLKTLDLSSNSFKLNLSSNWVPPFRLDFLDLSGCKLGQAFPNWIKTQENLVHLGISNSGISDVFPSWFSGMSNRLTYFNISHNKMQSLVPNFFSGEYIDLSNNHFDGPLPRFSSRLDILNLSKNNFSGNISLIICTQKFERLHILDLSSNLLSGCLPDCWMDKKMLSILDLSNNDFQETIPSSMGTLPFLSLRLSNNHLSGKLPSSFCSLRLISLLGLGGNQLSGKIPTCIGNLSGLVVLELESNKFWGDIPKGICHLQKVQTLDLSLNNLSGAIPTCLNNLTAMAQKESQSIDMMIKSMRNYRYRFVWSYFAAAWVTWKGTKAEYQKTLGLLKLIDLSSNRLSGEIPVQLASLYGLISLNLSSNKITGIIPGRIGQLQQLDSLDLSNNQLSGKIPESMSNISRLDYLNLSNNNFSGRIPSSTQMQSFNATAFAGNPGLCGLPLATKCPGDGNSYPPPIINHGSADDSNQEDEQWFKSPWFYGSVVLGYAFGFWGVCAPLVLYAPFRQAYYQFLNRVKDSLLLAIALKRAKLKRWLQS